MLKYALLAIGAAVLVALVFVLLPIGSSTRPDPRILTNGDQPPSTSFTIRDAAPPAPTEAAPPPAADLDAVMQRLRNGGTGPAAAQDATAPAPSPPPAPPATAAPAPATQAATAPSPSADAAASAGDAAPTASQRFPTVTGQGTRWRMARAGNGFTISIDMGGGHVADVHVLPAFANLDPAAINVRVDYLRETILQHFPHQSGSYSFARDGSVSLEH